MGSPDDPRAGAAPPVIRGQVPLGDTVKRCAQAAARALPEADDDDGVAAKGSTDEENTAPSESGQGDALPRTPRVYQLGGEERKIEINSAPTNGAIRSRIRRAITRDVASRPRRSIDKRRQKTQAREARTECYANGGGRLERIRGPPGAAGALCIRGDWSSWLLASVLVLGRCRYWGINAVGRQLALYAFGAANCWR